MTVAALLLCKLKLVVNTERLNVEVELCLVVHQKRVRTWLATVFWLPKTQSKPVCLHPDLSRPRCFGVSEGVMLKRQPVARLTSESLLLRRPWKTGDFVTGAQSGKPFDSELLSSSEVNLSFKLQSNRFDSDHSIKVKTRFCIFRLILAVRIRL